MSEMKTRDVVENLYLAASGLGGVEGILDFLHAHLPEGTSRAAVDYAQTKILLARDALQGEADALGRWPREDEEGEC